MRAVWSVSWPFIPAAVICVVWFATGHPYGLLGMLGVSTSVIWALTAVLGVVMFFWMRWLLTREA